MNEPSENLLDGRLVVLAAPGNVFCTECGYSVWFDPMQPRDWLDYAVFSCRTVQCGAYNIKYKLPLQRVWCERVQA